QVFDASLSTGIGSFAIDPSASGTASGIIVLTYDLFSVSPNDPTFSPDDEISGGNFLTANASVTVVPEPSSLVLLGAGLVAAGLHRKRVPGGGDW
ncbi:MAG TPA: PEP-CTERM sorting domain-containing protein, partial [Solirubrobacteraceae bacterium]|nr:PEP-CTERM sorting domain-containing protein [Solirubrobacteraceae bacterium]